jgi:hypothetical protein
MFTVTRPPPQELAEGEWVPFSGGELEGKRPKVLCIRCREAIRQWSAGSGAPAADRLSGRPKTLLCFDCHRAGIVRDRALGAAGHLNTASVARFQTALPFEPINRPRLEMLKVERSAARVASLGTPPGRLDDRRRRAQIAARHALQRVVGSLAAAGMSRAAQARATAAAIHAAELQLPESWLPFVMSR